MLKFKISYFHLLHMFSHFSWTNIVDIQLFVFGFVYTFVDALIELPLVKLHLQHEEIQLLALLLHTTSILLDSIGLQAFLILSFFDLQESLLDLGIHEFQPEYLRSRFAFNILKHSCSITRSDKIILCKLLIMTY